jgi:hypothetical protein
MEGIDNTSIEVRMSSYKGLGVSLVCHLPLLEVPPAYRQHILCVITHLFARHSEERPHPMSASMAATRKPKRMLSCPHALSVSDTRCQWDTARPLPRVTGRVTERKSERAFFLI